jgi:hypothetical protein
MPNGHDRNWVRFCCGAVDGFRTRYGRWPTRVLVSTGILADLRDNLFTPEDYEQIALKVVLVSAPEPGVLIAEDDTGARYDYAADGFPRKPSVPDAYEWFGIVPKPEA